MRHEIEALQAANKDLRDTAAEDEENDEAKTKLKVFSFFVISNIDFVFCFRLRM